jgi:hypothetical protein
MATTTKAGQAALQGWRKKVADTAAPVVARRTPMSEEQIRALIGVTFFVLALLYVIKTISALAREQG